MLLSLGKKSGGRPQHPCQSANTWSRSLCASVKELIPCQGLEVAWLRRRKDTFLGRVPSPRPREVPEPAWLLFKPPGAFITISVTHLNQHILAKMVRIFLSKL